MGKADTLFIHEIYASIQGESTFAGLPCVFVRTTGCNLRCAWCDTREAFEEGVRMSRPAILNRVLGLSPPLVELTGGEPLLQPGAIPLLAELCDTGRTILLETSGEADVSPVDPRVHKIMDIKAPGSGEAHRTRWSNLDHIRPTDELKFVLADRADYEFMREVLDARCLVRKTPKLLASPVLGALPPQDLAAWVLEDALPVRVQVQLHKIIWPPGARGV
jgi:7-carboxy-7-deazaguanine synthase